MIKFTALSSEFLTRSPARTPLGRARVRISSFVALTKPRVVSLIVFTAVIGMLLATPGAVPLPILLAATLGIALVAGAAAAGFPAERSVVDHIYLVDPLGNLMMRFPHDPDPARVIKDLQRLLKASSFG